MATVSLGVGVDVRVKNVVSFSLGATPEDTVQEAGRCVRGSVSEVGNERGYAFFFQKGALAAVHCKPSSDCRVLVSEPLPSCQTKVLFQFFQFNFSEETVPCNCCYSCIKRDADLGCDQCREFIDTYLSPKKMHKVH